MIRAIVVTQVRGVAALVQRFGTSGGVARVRAMQDAAREVLADAEHVAVDPVGVAAVFGARERALLAALDAHAAMARAGQAPGLHLHGPLVTAAIGFGEVVIEDVGAYGAEPALARRLAAFVPAGAEVVATDAVMRGLALPVGLGAHVGGQAYINAIGAPFHVLADHRD